MQHKTTTRKYTDNLFFTLAKKMTHKTYLFLTTCADSCQKDTTVEKSTRGPPPESVFLRHFNLRY